MLQLEGRKRKYGCIGVLPIVESLHTAEQDRQCGDIDTEGKEAVRQAWRDPIVVAIVWVIDIYIPKKDTTFVG